MFLSIKASGGLYLSIRSILQAAPFDSLITKSSSLLLSIFCQHEGRRVPNFRFLLLTLCRHPGMIYFKVQAINFDIVRIIIRLVIDVFQALPTNQGHSPGGYHVVSGTTSNNNAYAGGGSCNTCHQ
jgi:hypothetical protein